MSRFIDKLNQVSRTSSQPVGFRATPAAVSKSKMLLVADLAAADLDDVAKYVAGADAGLLSVSELSPGAKASKKALQAAPSIPWGGWLRDAGTEEMTQLVDAGCDFVVFPTAGTALRILQTEEIGKILQVEVPLAEGLLRSIDKLPVDAVLIGSEQKEERSLTWHDLMHFQYCADLLAKPLLASIPSNLIASELQALWEAGVDGVVVQLKAGQTAGRLMQLRQAIDGLTLPLQRKGAKPAALVPNVGGRAGTTEEPEEE